MARSRCESFDEVLCRQVLEAQSPVDAVLASSWPAATCTRRPAPPRAPLQRPAVPAVVVPELRLPPASDWRLPASGRKRGASMASIETMSQGYGSDSLEAEDDHDDEDEEEACVFSLSDVPGKGFADAEDEDSEFGFALVGFGEEADDHLVKVPGPASFFDDALVEGLPSSSFDKLGGREKKHEPPFTVELGASPMLLSALELAAACAEVEAGQFRAPLAC